jgi:hypothetical protein
MCFSAEASFVGAGVVGAVGVATLTQVKERKEILLGALPLGFAVHQLLEGITWMRLDGAFDGHLRGWGVHLWVLYAWALLPAWLPIGVRLIEPDERRRKWMIPLVVIGVALALLMVTQALQPAIEVRVLDSNLDYMLPIDIGVFLAVPYILATCVSPILSSHRWIVIFGIGNVLALSAATIMKAADFSSIWCTFAAGLSVLIFLHFYTTRQGEKADAPQPVVT